MEFSIAETVQIFSRWVHAISAITWVGGSIFFAVVIRTACRIDPVGMNRVMPYLTRYYGDMVDLSVVAIIFSGIILTLDRLTSEAATATYGAVLALKVGLATVMFYQVWNQRQSGTRTAPTPLLLRKISWLLGYNALVALGIVVYLLANILATLFTNALSVG